MDIEGVINMADYKLQVRIPQELADELFQTMKEKQEKMAGADVTVSSIARYALEKCVEDYRATKKCEKIFIPLNVASLSVDELKQFQDLLDMAGDKAKADGSAHIWRLFDDVASYVMQARHRKEFQEFE
jgi:hypothetical protein